MIWQKHYRSFGASNNDEEAKMRRTVGRKGHEAGKQKNGRWALPYEAVEKTKSRGWKQSRARKIYAANIAKTGIQRGKRVDCDIHDQGWQLQTKSNK